MQSTTEETRSTSGDRPGFRLPFPTLADVSRWCQNLAAPALGAVGWLVALGLLAAAAGAAAAGLVLWILSGNAVLMGFAAVGSCVFATGSALAFGRCIERAERTARSKNGR